MSEQYTPTWDRVREHYYLGRQQFDDPLFPAGGVTEIVAEFDRWYQAEVAAAEQRGAEATLREVADISEAWQNLFRKDVSDRDAYMLAWRLRIALHNRADTYSADQMGG